MIACQSNWKVTGHLMLAGFKSASRPSTATPNSIQRSQICAYERANVNFSLIQFGRHLARPDRVKEALFATRHVRALPALTAIKPVVANAEMMCSPEPLRRLCRFEKLSMKRILPASFRQGRRIARADLKALKWPLPRRRQTHCAMPFKNCSNDRPSVAPEIFRHRTGRASRVLAVARFGAS